MHSFSHWDTWGAQCRGRTRLCSLGLAVPTVKSRAEQQDCNHELRKWTGETGIFFLFLYLPLFFS